MSAPRRHLLHVLVLLCSLSPAFAQEEDLSVITPGKPNNERWIERSHGPTMLLRHLNRYAFDHLDRRRRDVAALRTAADWTRRQEYVRRTLDELLGPWPEKTPLQPRVTETIEKEGYRIEKLIYQSQPRFYVTAALNNV